MTICSPVESTNFCATPRPGRSSPPPAGYGISMRTGRLGYGASAAPAGIINAPITIMIDQRHIMPAPVVSKNILFACSIHFRARALDHVGPLGVFLADEFAELG